MTRELQMALTRVIETSKAPPAAVNAKRKMVNTIKAQIDDMRSKMDTLATQFANRQKDPQYVAQKTALDKKMADLKLKLSNAQQELKAVRGTHPKLKISG